MPMLIGPFLASLIFEGWVIPGFGALLLGLLIPLIWNDIYQSAPMRSRIEFAVALLVLAFLAKLLRQYWVLYSGLEGRIGVIAGRTAEKGSTYEFVVQLKPFASAHEDQLLTLYAGGSGIPQAVAVLRVVDTRQLGMVVATPLAPAKLISRYFSEDSRRRALFALSTISLSAFNGAGRE